MNNIWLMAVYTLREALAKKIFVFFLIISGLVILGLALIMSLVDIETLRTTFQSAEGIGIFEEVATRLEIMIIIPLTTLGLLLAIFASSSFIPSMLEKGNIDLLLSKPVSRTQLLIGKYIGGIIFVFINIGVIIVGIWIVISLKFSFWNFSLLWVVLLITFTFAILYSIIVLFGVITRSSIFGMMIAYAIFLVVSPVLLFLKENGHSFIESMVIRKIVEGLYYFFPKTSELTNQYVLLAAQRESITNYQPILTSFLFLILIMIYSIFLFKRKDF